MAKLMDNKSLENRPKNAPAHWPFTVIKTKVITIPDTMGDELGKNCFKFEHINLPEIQIDAADTMCSPQPSKCDFTNHNYAQTFMRYGMQIGQALGSS